MGLANEKHQSLCDAVINVAAIGLSLNPALKFAYLVPRDGRCCLDVSYMGLIKIATDTGSIKWAQAEVVCSADTFEYRGPTEKPMHVCDPFNSDRGEVTGVYCVAKTVDGDYLTEVMSLAEIHKVRDMSPAYTRSKKGPWVTFPNEMAKKAVIKRASKTWPKSDTSNRLETAIAVVNEHEGIDFSDDRKMHDLFMETPDPLGMYLFVEKLRADCGRDVELMHEKMQQIQHFPHGQIGVMRTKFKDLGTLGGDMFQQLIEAIDAEQPDVIGELIEDCLPECLELLENHLGHRRDNFNLLRIEK